MACKVIVLGSLEGKLETAFKKIATLHSKNKFAFCIITGNLFSAEQDEDLITRLLDGKIAVPLTTYFTVATHALPPQIVERIEKNEEICENLHFLGKRSTITTSDGIRIVTLGGILDREILGGSSKEQHLPFHTAGDATALRGANKTDILLTSTWSSNIWANSKLPLDPANKNAVASSPEVAELCTALKPRYHLTFSPADFFYEREPFFYPTTDGQGDVKQVTRFISMAPYGNAAKQKAVNENLATHMVCSIGEDAYITTAKGPLPPSDHFADQGLTFPGHQIIIPLPHEPTIRAMHAKGPDGRGPETFAEMTRFREALQAMTAAQSNYKLGVVTWEISRAKNIHHHWQLMPVPANLIRDGLIELGFKAQAEDSQHPPSRRRTDTGIVGKQLVMPIDDTFRFDLQLPRKVLAKFLNLEHRFRWQDVEQSVAEETEDATQFKATFKKWDFAA
ncbi:hypothetical protein PG995_000631 [Apiospora arundinis]